MAPCELPPPPAPQPCPPEEQCEKCQRRRVDGFRFCRKHCSRIMRAMKRSGYLQEVPRDCAKHEAYYAMMHSPRLFKF